MRKEFINFIKSKKLFKKKEKMLLAVSGGVDSVVMCHLFKESGYDFGIAHCNFQLRGDEADGDEKFVKSLAQEYGVPFHVIKFDTKAYSKQHKISIQEAARDLRYEWLEGIRVEHGFDWLITAHHKDDSIETFLYNLVRGTGIAGLHGILEKKGTVVRPLLFASKAEIVDYAKSNELPYREDSSNSSNKYSRNKIRNQVLPLLREVNPAVDDHIATEIERLREVEGIYQSWMGYQKEWSVTKKGKEIRISIEMLQAGGFPEALLFEILKPYGFHGDIVEDIVSNLGRGAGKMFHSPTHELLKDREYLVLRKKTAASENTYSIEVEIEEIKEPVSLKIQLTENSESFKIPASKKVACIDADKLKFPLTLRKWKAGDYFFPLGMKGKKKLSDFFVDNKLSLFEKENTWLLTSGNKIVWVVGYRVDNRFKVGIETKKIYLFSLK